jgi:hypothetical protein
VFLLLIACSWTLLLKSSQLEEVNSTMIYFKNFCKFYIVSPVQQ